MSSVAAHPADDIGGEVALLGTVVFAVADLAAVLTRLVLIVSKGTVEGGKFTELVTLEFVLTFWDGGGLRVVSNMHAK